MIKKRMNKDKSIKTTIRDCCTVFRIDSNFEVMCRLEKINEYLK